MDDMLFDYHFRPGGHRCLGCRGLRLEAGEKIGSRSALVLHGGVAHCSPEGAKSTLF